LKVIILAGGLGTRLSEETDVKPKPMVLIDGKPVLWHLMNSFSAQGYHDFVIALGYRGEVIKRWLMDLYDLSGDITIDSKSKEIQRSDGYLEHPWRVSTFDTGLNSQTGGRIAKCMSKLPGERVIATYGDGLANVPIDRLLDFHKSHGKFATVTAVRPPARFGQLSINDNRVSHFGEKSQTDSGWINGGYFVLEPQVADYVLNDDEPFETGALPRLVAEGELMAFCHESFWQPMDTLREKNILNDLAKKNPPPWLSL